MINLVQLFPYLISFDPSNPTDDSIVSQFPSNERDSRAALVSAWAVEHDNVDGRHSFGTGNTAARDAITTWTTGAIWINTSAGTGDTVLQTVVSVTASVPGWDDVGKFSSADEAKLDAVISASSATSAEADAGTETGIRAWSPIIIKAAVSANIPIASQAEMETATNNTNVVTPLRTNDHPGVCKAWSNFTAISGTVVEKNDYNVSSVGDDGVGEFTINLATDMSDANYAVFTTAQRDNANPAVSMLKGSTTNNVVLVGSFGLRIVAVENGIAIEPRVATAGAFGDQ